MPIIETMARKDVIVVTEPEQQPDFEMVKIEAVTSLAEAYEMVKGRYGSDLRVGNFPYGKWTLPVGLNAPKA
jgi:hypothetical protein